MYRGRSWRGITAATADVAGYTEPRAIGRWNDILFTGSASSAGYDEDIGTVAEVFHRIAAEPIIDEGVCGVGAIGHVRYATCGKDDRNYAQPFERQHIHKHKWFSFCFNGQLANYAQLRSKLLREANIISKRVTPTPKSSCMNWGEHFVGASSRDIASVFAEVAKEFDGAYSLAFLNARGELLLARDPLGIKPLCYAIEGSLFAAASESVALLNLGFQPENIHSLLPGHLIVVRPDGVQIKQFAESPRTAHCFFEWIYFANVASTLDQRSVYLSRTRLGEELADLERAEGHFPLKRHRSLYPYRIPARRRQMLWLPGDSWPRRFDSQPLQRSNFHRGGRARISKAVIKYTLFEKCWRANVSFSWRTLLFGYNHEGSA